MSSNNDSSRVPVCLEVRLGPLRLVLSGAALKKEISFPLDPQQAQGLAAALIISAQAEQQQQEAAAAAAAGPGQQPPKPASMPVMLQARPGGERN